MPHKGVAIAFLFELERANDTNAMYLFLVHTQSATQYQKHT